MIEDSSPDDEDYEECPGCERAPAKGYYRCPVCDAEWPDEDED